MMLFAPGPVNCHLDNMDCTQDPPYFAGPEFSKLMLEIQPNLQEVFKTVNPVLIGTGSGSLAMENSVTNFFSPGDTVIVINNGKYGNNFKEICIEFGLNVIEFLAADGDIVHPNLVSNFLKSTEMKIKGFFTTHVETTTGVLNPIYEYLHLLLTYSPETLTIIDAISSLLSEHIISDAFDVVISASQKGFQLPAGLFFMSVSERAKYACSTSKIKKYYFDVEEELKRQTKGVTRFTPASDLFPLLLKRLNSIVGIGVHNILEKASNVAEMTRTILFSSQNFIKFTDYPSSAVTIAQSQDSNQILRYLKAKNIVVGGGVRLLSGKVIRMRNFGFLTSGDDFRFVAQTAANWERELKE